MRTSSPRGRRNALAYARKTVETELNCAQGNPAVVQLERQRNFRR